MRRWISLVLLSLLSCGQQEYSVAQCRALAEPNAFVQRCMGGKLNGAYVGDLKCWPFSKPQRLRGILRVGFEHSEFFPNATSPREIGEAEARIWFNDESTEAPPKALQGPPDGLTHTFFVEAEGRLSLCDGRFGHQGQYPRELIANRIITARPA